MKRTLVIVLVAIAAVALCVAESGAAEKKAKAEVPAGSRWDVDPKERDFGEVAVGETRALGLKVLNNGSKQGTTRCSKSGPGAAWFVVDKTGDLVIPENGAIEVTITLDPKGAKVKKDTPAKASISCAGKRAEAKGVVKPKVDVKEEKKEGAEGATKEEAPMLWLT